MAADDQTVCIKDLRPGMKNVTCVFIVIDRGTTNQTKDGSTVRKCRVGDRTGSVCFSLWNEQAGAIEAGDILKLTRGYASLWKGGMMLYSGKYGKLEKIGEFTMVFSELPDMSDPSHEFAQQYQKPQVQNAVGGVRPPRNQNGNNHTSLAVAVEGARPSPTSETNRTTLPPPHPHFAPTQPNHFMPPRHLAPSNPPFQPPHPYPPPNSTFRRPPFPNAHPQERPPYTQNTHLHVAPLNSSLNGTRAQFEGNGTNQRHSECSDGRGKSRYHPYPSPNHHLEGQRY